MEYWETKVIDLGEVLEDTSVDVVFNTTKDCPILKRVKPGCGCTTTKFDEITGKLKVKLNLGKIPFHLKVDKQEFEKHIDIEYGDIQDLSKITADRLSIIGYKIRK